MNGLCDHKGCRAAADVRPVTLPSSPAGGVLAALDEVIAAKQSDIETLERAKEIVSRG